MPTERERRRVARLPIPSQFSSPGQEEEPVRLLDLSPEGARIEHLRPVPDWRLCYLTLPPALGGIRLQGEVIWSRVLRRKWSPKGLGLLYHQSGLSFLLLTPPQQDGLAAALKRLHTARERPPSE